MAENITRHITHIKSKVVENGSPKLPTAAQIQEGEIGVNYAKGLETLSIKNESGDVVTFSSDNYYTEKKLGSGFTGTNSANTVTKVIEDNELVWTNAYVAMSGIVSAHTASTSMHLTSAEKTKIDNMPSTFGSMASENTSDYYKKSDTSGKTEISTALAGKSNTGHTHDGTYAKNAFYRVTAGGVNVDADTTADTLTFSAGTFIGITGNVSNDRISFNVNTGTSNTTIARGDHTHYIGDLSGASEFGEAAFLNVGDESGTVAAGDHNHDISTLEGVSDFANQLYTGITSDIGSSLGGAAYLNTGTTNGTVAAGNHTHTTTIAAGNSSNISLAFGSKYTLSAGGTSYSFTMPSSASTWTDNNRRCFYASGNTAAGTNAKTASIGSATGWELTSGTTVGVKFTYTNTYTGSSNITLNVNSSGARQIYYKGTLNPTKPNPNVYGTAGRTIYYMYDGTYWVWMGMDGYGDAAFLNVGTTTGTVAAGDHTHSGYLTGVTLASGTNNGTLKLTVNGSATDNIAVKGLGSAAYLSTGTTSGTVAKGDHNHDGTYAKNAFTTVTVGSTNVVADTTADTLTLSAGTFVKLTPDATNDKVTFDVNTGTSSSTVAVGNHTHSGYVGTGTSVSTASGLTGGGNLSTNRTIGLAATGTAGTYYQVKTDSYGRVTSGSTTSPNSVRQISVNGTSFLASSTTTTALNIKSGTCLSVTTGSSGALTFAVVTGTAANTVATGDHTHSGYVGTGCTITAGTGLSGGGNLSADRTLSLAMPTTYSASTYTSASITSSEPIVYALVRANSNLTNQVCPVSLVDGQQCNVIYMGSTTAATYTVTISTTYTTPTGQAISALTVPSKGYVEINYLNIKGITFVRGV